MNIAKQYVYLDEPAAPDGDSGFAKWVQIAVILMRVELDKSLRESQAWFKDTIAVLDELGFDKSPHYCMLCRWEQKF